MAPHLVHEVAVEVIDAAALHTLEMQMLAAMAALVDVLEHRPFALVGDIFHDALLARQLVEVAVDRGGVGACPLRFQMLEDVGRTDCVLAVVDEVIEDQLPGLGVVSIASCHAKSFLSGASVPHFRVGCKRMRLNWLQAQKSCSKYAKTGRFCCAKRKCCQTFRKTLVINDGICDNTTDILVGWLQGYKLEQSGYP